MLDDNSILEFEFSHQPRVKQFWHGVLARLTAVLIILVLTSYQPPQPSSNSSLVPYRTIDFQFDLQGKVYSMVDYSNPDSLHKLSTTLNNLVKVFYHQNDFMPVWTNGFNTNPQFQLILNLIDSAKYFGFPFDYFNLKSIKNLAGNFVCTKSLESRIELELAVTHSAFKLMLYLNRGIAERDTINTHNDFLDPLPTILGNAILNNSLRDSILALQPNLIKYRKIVSSLPYFIDLIQSIKHTTPKFIDEHLLAKSLFYAGITEKNRIDTNESNTRAIHRLQEKFNLPRDSVLDISTHGVLVSLLEYRYYQACLNINRLRALQNTNDNYLFVNIPEFKLHVIESQQEKEIFNVIVGKTDTPTPVFSSSIEKVVTNPYWTVPRSIFLKEKLQSIRRDSTYLSRNGYYVINGREEAVDMSEIDWDSMEPLGSNLFLRQRSSPYNALGSVKIMFPNSYSVYIHDTPSRGLFSQQSRTFSYGCIRLENPDRLAQYLSDTYISQNNLNIQNLIRSQQSKEINLEVKVPIHIQYITCSGRDNSDIEFYSDIYNWDSQEMATVFPGLIEL